MISSLLRPPAVLVVRWRWVIRNALNFLDGSEVFIKGKYYLGLCCWWALCNNHSCPRGALSLSSRLCPTLLSNGSRYWWAHLYKDQFQSLSPLSIQKEWGIGLAWSRSLWNQPGFLRTWTERVFRRVRITSDWASFHGELTRWWWRCGRSGGLSDGSPATPPSLINKQEMRERNGEKRKLNFHFLSCFLFISFSRSFSLALLGGWTYQSESEERKKESQWTFLPSSYVILIPFFPSSLFVFLE